MFNCGIEASFEFFVPNRGFEKNRENQRNTTLLVLMNKKKDI